MIVNHGVVSTRYLKFGTHEKLPAPPAQLLFVNQRKTNESEDPEKVVTFCPER